MSGHDLPKQPVTVGRNTHYMTAIELAMPYLLKGMPEELKQRHQEEAANDELFTPEDFDSYFGNELQSVG